MHSASTNAAHADRLETHKRCEQHLATIYRPRAGTQVRASSERNYAASKTLEPRAESREPRAESREPRAERQRSRLLRFPILDSQPFTASHQTAHRPHTPAHRPPTAD
ncbi:hypothetical protein IXO74_012955 [Xanthomonas oryzae pv. oryzae]|nr:hypothetical protein IXO35_000140 [Xanthomonas oryzae pv. oryzae]UXV94244.1 hypothetical protein IXO74_012955 [Xanthomonas oryzae pv. oryzae]WJS69861.1 hypothetical protein DXO50_000140 [Xanthomonas oryzae pv. oryzae]WJS77525.1 hypothetical protein DXO133_002105 [Xanthomonas oryzae pv. oryzae]